MGAQATGVLVGVDGSACAETALRWAAADAAARHVPLTVVNVVDLPRLAGVPLSAELVATAGRAGRQIVDRAARSARDALRDIAPDLQVEGAVHTGDPAGTLLRLAGDADEVVVGSHGHGGLVALLIGSVSAKLAEHAPVPVVVVRGPGATAGRPAEGRTPGRVVVGVDGSERSEAALEQGFGYADRHGLDVTVTHVYTGGAYLRPVAPYPLPPYPTEEDLARLREQAVRITEQAVARWTEKYPDLLVRIDVVDDLPVHHLVEASRGAAVLVVGTRGLGGLAGMLLGSVSQAVTRHADCPVAVAR